VSSNTACSWLMTSRNATLSTRTAISSKVRLPY
jgi:hypothetical protein